MPWARPFVEAGVWKVAKSTFCARMIIENPSLASRGACAR